MAYTETLASLAATAQASLLGLLDTLEAGEITKPEFVALAVASLGVSASRAVALADLAVAAEVSVHHGAAVPTRGLSVPQDTHARHEAAVRATVAAGLTAESVRVLGRAQSMRDAQIAYQRGMQDHGIEYWTRRLDADACELCNDLAGATLPITTEMYAHKGCGCSQKPIWMTKENSND